MSSTATPRPVSAPEAAESPSAPAPLLGMYALVFTVLGCIGVFAGEIFFLDDRAVSAGHDRVVARCLHGSVTDLRLDLPAFDRCASGSFRLEGLFALAVAVAVLAMAVALSLIEPRMRQRRLARSVAPAAPDRAALYGVAEARFEMLCDQTGLTGRWRPRLLVGDREQRKAETTGLPRRRPLIVIPPKTAGYAGVDPSGFDPVVLHELAHVRARDVSWVSSVRNITWITVPAVALACLPELSDVGGGQFSGTVLAQAAVFVAATALIALELLRRREIEADRQAVQWLGSARPLQQLLVPGGRPARAKTGTTPGWWTRPLAGHPSMAGRIAALDDPLGRQDGGFVYTLVAGLVTVLATNTAYFLAWTLDEVDGGWLPARVSACAGAIVLGLSLTPALLRRAARAQRTGTPAAWWQPVAGTASGMLLGALIPPSATPGATASVLAGMDPRRVIITLSLACAGAGLATLAAGLASLAVGGRERRWPGALPAWLTVAVSCCAAAALWPIPGYITGVTWRQWVAVILPADQWHWLVVPYLGTALLLTVKGWWRGGSGSERPSVTGTSSTWRTRAQAAAVPVITPVCAAAVGATLFLACVRLPAIAPYATVVHVTDEWWWACALTGWVVLVVLVLARGVRGLAWACLSAWLATLLTGLALIAHGVPAIWGTFAPSSSAVTTSSMWLFYLTLPTACLALVRPRQLATAKYPWIAPAGASAAAAMAAALVLGTGLPGTFGPPPAAGPAAPPPPPATPRAGQILTQSAAQHIAAAVGRYLDLGSVWIPGSFPAAAPALVTYKPAGCAALAHEYYLNALPTPLARAEDRYKAAPALPDDTLETLSVRVESFLRPVPSSLLAAATRIFRACPRYGTQTSGSPVAGANGASFVTARTTRLRGLGFPAWRADISMDLDPGSASVTWVMITAGHNFLLISQQTISHGSWSQPDEKVIADAVAATMDALAHAAVSQASLHRTGA
jgi:Zn-dependent protease with chaperone function